MKLGQVVTFKALDGQQLQGTVWSSAPGGCWWLTRAPARFVLVRSSRGGLIETEPSNGRTKSRK